MQGVRTAYRADVLRLPPAVLPQTHLVQGRCRDVLLGVLEDGPEHPQEKGKVAMLAQRHRAFPLAVSVLRLNDVHKSSRDRYVVDVLLTARGGVRLLLEYTVYTPCLSN